ncbi:VRR-NUC domain-containing protein, partial [Bacillus subtilis]
MKESQIESYLRDKIKALGGIAYKFVSPGNSGVPDRMVLLPKGRTVFVELKAPGKKPTKLQLVQHKR